MFDYFSSPTSTIPPPAHPRATAHEDLSAPRMTRTSSSSSTSSNTSSASLYFSSPYSATRPSSSASPSSSFWSCPSTSTSPSTSYVTASGSTSRPSHHRHMSNGTSYLPTPYRSSLLHSSSASSPSPQVRQETSSYISDDDLLALDFEPLPPPSDLNSDMMNTHMTTEEQVAAVRDQVERERREWGLRPQQAAGMAAFGPPVERKRTLRFAPEVQTRRSGQHAGAAGRRRYFSGPARR